MLLDIHTHILPNIDDGSPNIETSIEMIKESIDTGVTDIFVTPHHMRGRYIENIDDIKNKFALLKEEVKKQNLKVNLYLGEEIYISHLENASKLLDQKELLTLNGSKAVLIEFSLSNKPEDFEEIVYNLVCSGYKPIVAHAERYNWITFDEIKFLKNEGALIQVNSDSLLGKNATFKEKMLARKLYKKHMVDYIASDMHSFRRTSLAIAMKKFRKYPVNSTDILNIK